MNANPDIIFLPDWRDDNPYQNLLAAGIQSTGLKVDFANYPNSEFPLLTLVRNHPTVRVIHLHWVNPYMGRIFWSGSPLKALIRTWLMALDVLMVRLRGIKVIWTVHNRLSHESPDIKRELTARRWLARVVNQLIFHSAEARTEVEQLLGLPLLNRSVVIPHGHYIGMYPPDPARTQQLHHQFGLSDDDTVILFFGALRRYKGITQLLQAFSRTGNPKLKLIIAGRPFEDEIVNEIEQAAVQDSRIMTYLGFVPTEDVAPLYAIADIAVVPFEKTLTSGSAILALSLGTALILPEEARVIGLPDIQGTLFFSGAEHLLSILDRLSDMDLDSMGAINLKAAKQLDWLSIGHKISEIYNITTRADR